MLVFPEHWPSFPYPSCGGRVIPVSTQLPKIPSLEVVSHSALFEQHCSFVSVDPIVQPLLPLLMQANAFGKKACTKKE